MLGFTIQPHTGRLPHNPEYLSGDNVDSYGYDPRIGHTRYLEMAEGLEMQELGQETLTTGCDRKSIQHELAMVLSSITPSAESV